MTQDISRTKLAIVLPVFKHSGLVVEAIHSALEDPGVVIVAVNDGCPFEDTDHTLGEFALAEPRVHYIRKPNGGLSSARNHGIDYVLANFPDVEAIYLLDADNLLQPRAVSRAWGVLEASSADWLYPGIYMFGLRHKFDYSGEYSLLTNLSQNICEAGSLIKRRVLESGVRFDENMKKGYEDWEFWLNCAANGFKGECYNELGLLYRKRAESMLRDSDRDHEEIVAYIRGKWKRLFKPASILALEAEEAPRFGFIEGTSNRMLSATDPVDLIAEGTQAIPFCESAIEHNRARKTTHFPPFLVFGTALAMQVLKDKGLLRSAFWAAERRLDDKHGVFICLEESEDRISVQPGKSSNGRASLFFISSTLFLSCASDKKLDWAKREFSADTSTTLEWLSIGAPFNNVRLQSAHSNNADRLCIDYLKDVRAENGGPLVAPIEGERMRTIANLPERYKLARRLLKASPLYPVRRTGAPTAGFVLPVASYGGVEQVAYAMAREFRAQGYTTRLVVAGTGDFRVSSRNADCFDEISIIPDRELLAGSDGKTPCYMGQRLLPATQTSHPHINGLLHDLDVFLNFHSSHLNGLAGELKRQGCVTVSSVHVFDESSTGRLVGHPYHSLAYEHAYDLMAPCSERMGDWLKGMGVPRNKVVTVPNAADFGALPRRPRTDGDAPLRVLLLGRFDYQKGLDRLEAIIRLAAKRKLDLEWRVVGSSLLDDIGIGNASAGAARFSVSPAIFDKEELEREFANADVLLMLSRWEGLPLTIIEAMGHGVVPVVTDVGAINELVVDGENGRLLPSRATVGTFAEAGAEILGELSLDRAMLESLSSGAASTAAGRNWNAATAPLVQRCSQIISSRR